MTAFGGAVPVPSAVRSSDSIDHDAGERRHHYQKNGRTPATNTVSSATRLNDAFGQPGALAEIDAGYPELQRSSPIRLTLPRPPTSQDEHSGAHAPGHELPGLAAKQAGHLTLEVFVGPLALPRRSAGCAARATEGAPARRALVAAVE